MSVNKKRKDLSVTEKLRLIDTYDKLNLKSLSQTETAAKLGVPQSNLSKFVKSNDTLEANTTNENRNRKLEGKCDAVDEALLVWFKQISSYNAPINRSILLQKANDLGEKLEDFRVTVDG
jgi:predicted transcriptional regulator